MKLVAILGSPRGMAGNTGTVLEALLTGARGSGAEVTTFSLAELDVQPCTGCEACHIAGNCPTTDDFAPILEAMSEADGLVLASPNYIRNVTAQMKALLDRCSGPIHTQALAGKYAAALVTAGGADDDGVDSYLLRALRLLGYTTVGSSNTPAFQLIRPDTREAVLASSAELGRKLIEAIRTQQRFPEQDEERNAVMARMRQIVTMNKERWAYEYEVWEKKG